jgi:hypothetical protein
MECEFWLLRLCSQASAILSQLPRAAHHKRPTETRSRAQYFAIGRLHQCIIV